MLLCNFRRRAPWENALILTFALFVLLAGCSPASAGNWNTLIETQDPFHSEPADLSNDQEIPYYFIAIHCEPYYTDFNAEAKLAESFKVLGEMVKAADQYHIKLTLMFSPQYCDYILADASRTGLIALWKSSGHEIAYHHHCEMHGGWDGYSDSDAATARAARTAGGHTPPEPYLGTLTDMMNHVYALDSGVRAGCASGENFKQAIPDDILIDTSSGFANFGPVGTRMSDTDANKSRNDYMLVGDVDDISRTFLAHGHIIKESQRLAVQNVFVSMESGVSGAVTHAVHKQDLQFYKYLDFLHSQDPAASKSVTVTEVVDRHLIPEKSIDAGVLNATYH